MGFDAQTVKFVLPIRQARLPKISFPRLKEIEIIDKPITQPKEKITVPLLKGMVTELLRTKR